MLPGHPDLCQISLLVTKVATLFLLLKIEINYFFIFCKNIYFEILKIKLSMHMFYNII